MDFFRLSKYSFYSFLFFLPLQTVFLLREPFVRGEKWQYGAIGVYAVDILLVVTLGLVFIGCLRGKYHVSRIRYARAEIFLALFLFLAGLSIFWAEDAALAWYFFMKLLLAVGAFFLARSLDGVNVRNLIFVLMAAGVIQSGIGIGQFLLQQSVDSSLLGMNSYEAWQAGSSVLKIDGGRFLRAYGTFSHPNMLGGFLAVVLVSGFAYQIWCVAQLKRNQRIILLVGSLIILLGLVLTFSRAAWLGAGMGMFLLGVLVFLRKEWEIQKQFLKGMVVFSIAGAVFGSILHEQISPRFDSAAIERERSITERRVSLQDAETLIGEGNILHGAGIGNFTAEMMRLQPDRPVWGIQPAHNVFVLVFVELGLMGFLFFVSFLWSVLRNMKKQNAMFAIALLSLLPSLLLDHWLWTSHFGLLFFFLLLGLVQRR